MVWIGLGQLPRAVLQRLCTVHHRNQMVPPSRRSRARRHRKQHPARSILLLTDRFLAKIAESQGLEVVDIHVPRDIRVGSSIVDSAVCVGKTVKRNSVMKMNSTKCIY